MKKNEIKDLEDRKQLNKTWKLMKWITVLATLLTFGLIIGCFWIPSFYSINVSKLPDLDSGSHPFVYDDLNSLLDSKITGDNYNNFKFQISTKNASHSAKHSDLLSNTFLTGYMTQDEIQNNIGNANLQNQFISDVYSDNNLWSDLNSMLDGTKATLLEPNDAPDNNHLFVNYRNQTMWLHFSPAVIQTNIDQDTNGYQDSFCNVHIAESSEYNYQISYEYRIVLVAENGRNDFFELGNSYSYEYDKVIDRNLYQTLHLLDNVNLAWVQSSETNAALFQSILQTYYTFCDTGAGNNPSKINVLDGSGKLESNVNLNSLFTTGQSGAIEYDNQHDEKKHTKSSEIHDSLFELQSAEKKDELKKFNKILKLLKVQPLTISNNSSKDYDDKYSGYAPQDISTNNSDDWGSQKSVFSTDYVLSFAGESVELTGDWTQKDYSNKNKTLNVEDSSNFSSDASNVAKHIAKKAGGDHFSSDETDYQHFKDYVNNTNNYNSDIEDLIKDNLSSSGRDHFGGVSNIDINAAECSPYEKDGEIISVEYSFNITMDYLINTPGGGYHHSVGIKYDTSYTK